MSAGQLEVERELDVRRRLLASRSVSVPLRHRKRSTRRSRPWSRMARKMSSEPTRPSEMSVSPMRPP